MPELPDVEVFRQYIDATALHKTIQRVDVYDADRVMQCSVPQLKRRLTGRRFDATQRHGKHLGVRVDTGSWLMLHFGMTGELDYAKVDTDTPPHTRLCLRLANGYRLAYINQRKLGKIDLADDFGAFIDSQGLGPDALGIPRDVFTDLLVDGRGTLKARLMNQDRIAGLGNVYTDEVFFQARMHPGTPVSKVTSEQAAALWRTMRRVCRTAIKHRAEPGSFPDSWLTRHRDEDACPRCGGALKQKSIAGRTSRLCPACQPARQGRGSW